MCNFLVVFNRKREKWEKKKTRTHLCYYLGCTKNISVNSQLSSKKQNEKIMFLDKTCYNGDFANGHGDHGGIYTLALSFSHRICAGMDWANSLSMFFHRELKCFNKICHSISYNQLLHMLMLNCFHRNRFDFAKHQATSSCWVRCPTLSCDSLR